MNRKLVVFLSLLVVLIGGLTASRGAAQEPTPVDGTPVSGDIEGLYTFAPPDPSHVTGHIDYAQNPPIGGNHNGVWQNCGFYDQPVGNEHAVHSLEHGAVWITYDPNLAADQVDLLRQVVNLSGYILVSPYQGLPAPIVVSSWDHQLYLERADDPRLQAFLREFLTQGPEPGAPCAGGTSETIGFATPVAGSPVAATPVASPEA
jgi:hypothetical protein